MSDANVIANLPEVREVMGAAQQVADYAQALVVSNPEQYRDAGERLTLLMGAKKRLEDMRTRITKPINDGLKGINNLFRTPGDTLANAERLIKSKLGAYQTEQERLARIEQDRVNAIAQKEQDRLNELARRAAEAGRMGAAEKHQERAAAVVAPVVQREAPKVAGVAMRDAWKWALENIDLVPREYLMLDESKVNRYVTAMKADAKIAGVRVYSEKQIAAGSR